MSESKLILNHNNETVGVYFDLGASITVGEDNSWFGCGLDDDARHISVIKLDCSERVALFMKAVVDAHECAVAAVAEDDSHDALVGSLKDIVEGLRAGWEPLDVADFEDALAKHDAELFSVNKGETFIDPTDETKHVINRVTEDGEYCTVTIWQMGGPLATSVDAIRPVSFYRELRKLV